MWQHMAAGARPPCHVCRGKTLSSIHLYMYLQSCQTNQLGCFQGRGEGESQYFAHVQMLVLPLKSPDELVLCNAGLKFVRGAAII